MIFYYVPFVIKLRGSGQEARAKRKLHRRKVWKLALFTMFLVFPKVSSTVLSIYICRDIDGTSYLLSDFNILCYDARWYKYIPFDIVMIFVYPVRAKKTACTNRDLNS